VGEYNNMKKLIYIPIMSIAIGELLIFYDRILAGAGIHIISLLVIILIIIFGNLSPRTENILQSLILLPLLRIISLSIPQLSEKIYIQYLIIYGIVLIPIYLILKNQHVLHNDSGTGSSILLYISPSFKRVYVYAPTIVLTIIIIGMIGQYMSIIPDIQTISPDVTNVIGEFVSIFLIIILSISLLVSDTKYWNKYVSNSINIYSIPLLLTFVTIVIHKIMLIM
jgi:hypothetical protein